MIVIGTIKGTVNNAVLRSFQNKEKTRTFEYIEISFYCEEKRFCGILKDWDKTVPVTALVPGARIEVNYQACNPKKDCFGVFEFNGFPVLIK